MVFDPSIIPDSQKIQLTCDSTPISADQTDFPLTVVLDGTDPLHSALFTNLSYPSGDGFTGTDGDDPNPLLWTDPVVASGYTLDIQGNALANINDGTGDATNQLSSEFTFPGDFDIQVDVDLVNIGSGTGWYGYGLRMDDVTNSANTVWIQRILSSGTLNRIMTAFGTTYTYYSTTATSFSFRLKRTGSTVSVYYDIGAGWVLETTGTRSEELRVKLHFDSKPNVVSDVQMDNFVINSGTVTWPYDVRKRLSIEAGGVQCPVEIESWDIADSYISFYPPAFSDTYVNTTSTYNTTYSAWYVLNPALSLSGSRGNTSWLSANGQTTNQKFNVDLGEAKIITRIYLENMHNSGIELSVGDGIKDFVVYGTNEATAFANTTYATLTDLIELGSFQARKHSVFDGSDPQYFDLSSNDTAYRYYVLRIANNWGYTYLGFRRIEFQETAVVYGGSKAVLHTKVPTYSHATDPELVLSYDNSQVDNTGYVGEIGDTPAQNVWDSNYSAVYHMSQDPSVGGACILDSTANMNHGTPVGSWVGSDLVDGIYGKGLEFDTTKYITVPDSTSLNFTHITMEGFYIPTEASNDGVLTKSDLGGTQGEYNLVCLGGTTGYRVAVNDVKYLDDHAAVPLDWTHQVGTYDRVNLKSIINGVQTATTPYTAAVTLTADPLILGGYYTTAQLFYGTISEIRISNIARSADWIKLTNLSLTDQLITFSAFAVGLPGWDSTKKFKLALDTPASDLTDAVVSVPIGTSVGKNSFDASAVFDELGTNSLKVAFEIGDTGVQCNAEFEGFELVDSQFKYADTDPIAHWTMDNVSGSTLVDEMGTYDGTITNMTQTAGGKFDQYLAGGAIDSTARYVDFGAGGIPFTSFSAWIKRINITDVELICTNANNDNYFYINTSTDEILLGGGASGLYINDLDWHHITIVEGSTTDNWWLYLDGVKASSAVASGAFGNLRYLGRPDATINQNTVSFDNVQAYDYQLSDVEIAELYASQLPVASLYHVRVPSILSAGGNFLNFYYDSTQPDNTTYVGEIGSVAGQAVWNANYVAVYHMGDGLLDSTSNGNNLTNYGSTSVDGYHGKGRSFDGTDDHVKADNVLVNPSEVSVEGLFYIRGPGSTSWNRLIDLNDGVSTAKFGFMWDVDAGDPDYGFYDGANIDTGTPALNTWLYWFGKNNGTTAYFFENGVQENTGASALTTTTYHLCIGKRYDANDETDMIADEVRISNIARSDDWISYTYNSLTDNLITWSLPPVGGVIYLKSYVEQIYTLEWQVLQNFVEQNYHLYNFIRNHVDQIYGLHLQAFVSAFYSDAPILKAFLAQHFKDAPILNNYIEQIYWDAQRYIQYNEQRYGILATKQNFTICLYSVLSKLNHNYVESFYNIKDANELKNHLRQVFTISPSSNAHLTQDNTLTINSTPVPVQGIDIEFSQSSYVGDIEFSLARLEDWEALDYLQTITADIGGTVYSFLLDGKRKSESFRSRSTTATGKSKGILLDFPYASPIPDDFQLGSASDICNRLAATAGITFTWEMPLDWNLTSEDVEIIGESPKAGIVKILSSVGAILQSNPDGSLYAVPNWEINSNELDTADPDYSLSTATNFISTESTPLKKDGYNSYYISNVPSSSADYRMEYEARDAGGYLVKVYQQTWTNTPLTLVSSDIDSVRITRLADVYDELHCEEIAIKEGAGTLDKPVSGIVSFDYKDRTDLGNVTPKETGEVTTFIKGESIVEIEYYTKYRQWVVEDDEIEKIQLILRSD